MMNSYQPEYETFKCSWLESAPKLMDQNDGHLWDKLLKCMEADMKKALTSKLGTYRLTEFSTSQLMVEIEKVSIHGQLDL